jgi:hypothetical protein
VIVGAQFTEKVINAHKTKNPVIGHGGILNFIINNFPLEISDIIIG